MNQSFKNLIQTIRAHPRRSLVIAIFLIILILAAILRALTPAPKVTPQITQQPKIKSPQITPVEGFNRPALNITWNHPDVSFPESLPYYSSTTPLLNSQNVDHLAGLLGFTLDDRIPTTSLSHLIYSLDSHSLTINLPSGPLTYFNSDLPSNPQSLSSLDSSIAAATALLTSLFPDSQFTYQAPPKYLFAQNNTFTQTTSGSAQFIELNFTQTIDGYPYLTSSVSSTPIRLVLNYLNQPQQLEIIGGISRLNAASDPLPLLTYQQLQKVAPEAAQKLSAQNIAAEYDINAQSQLDLSVDDLSLAYLSLPGDKSLQPVFRLSGTVSARNLNPTPVVYFVPAFQSDYYQQNSQ